MKEIFEVFSENHILILGIVLFILGLFMLGYLLTLIISNKRKEKMIMEKLYEEPIKEEPKLTTKVCPYCFTEININATRCPHCTSVLEEETNEVIDEQISIN